MRHRKALIGTLWFANLSKWFVVLTKFRIKLSNINSSSCIHQGVVYLILCKLYFNVKRNNYLSKKQINRFYFWAKVFKWVKKYKFSFFGIIFLIRPNCNIRNIYVWFNSIIKRSFFKKYFRTLFIFPRASLDWLFIQLLSLRCPHIFILFIILLDPRMSVVMPAVWLHPENQLS